jgi:hypothetical protein
VLGNHVAAMPPVVSLIKMNRNVIAHPNIQMAIHTMNVSYSFEYHLALFGKQLLQFQFYLSGNLSRGVSDCRVAGCTTGECIRQGVEYVCKQGKCYSLLSIY